MLYKVNRLRKSKDVSFVYTKGRGVFSPLFVVKYKFNNKNTFPRFTVVVSTKVAKKSNIRNTLKRRVRELLRKNLGNFKNADVIVSLKPSVKGVSKEILEDNLMTLFKKSQIWDSSKSLKQ